MGGQKGEGKQAKHGKGKGGLEKGQKGSWQASQKGQGKEKGCLEKGQKGKQASQGKGNGGLEQGQKGKQASQGKGKGGLEKGQKGYWQASQKGQGKDKGGLEEGHDKGGLEKSQEKEAHHSKIQEEIAAGFDPSLQESRGRQSRWARQERRRADQAVQDRKTEFETAGPRLEKKPVQQPQEGSQRHKAWLLLAEEVTDEEKKLCQQKEEWAAATKEKKDQRQELERLEQKLAWSNATGSQGPWEAWRGGGLKEGLQPRHERLEIKPERELEGPETRPLKKCNWVELARKTMEAQFGKRPACIWSLKHL